MENNTKVKIAAQRATLRVVMGGAQGPDFERVSPPSLKGVQDMKISFALFL